MFSAQLDLRGDYAELPGLGDDLEAERQSTQDTAQIVRVEISRLSGIYALPVGSKIYSRYTRYASSGILSNSLGRYVLKAVASSGRA
jgi:hypothetical protein